MSAEVVAQGANGIMVKGQGVMSEKEIRNLLEMSQGVKMPAQQRRQLIEAYREALSDDAIARDFHRRNWIESRSQQAVGSLPGKFKKTAAKGQVKITIEDYTELTDEQLHTLKEFFAERLRDLEAEEEDYIKALCATDAENASQNQISDSPKSTPTSSEPTATA